MPQETFRVAIPQDRIDNICRRVETFHVPTMAYSSGDAYGLPVADLSKLVSRWIDGYVWRTAEERLNATQQFILSGTGGRIHFARLGKVGSPALLLLHGWPYSFATMLPLAHRLAENFDVIVPSLPGFHFSDPAGPEPKGVMALSDVMHSFMTKGLGLSRFFVHGGDVGAEIADWLAVKHPGCLLGAHTHYAYLRHHGAAFGSGQTGVPDATPAEQAFVTEEAAILAREGAYYALQMTRPETLAPALSDSPVGWAAYMLDKWQKWSATRQRSFLDLYESDALLTEVMLYLVTDSIATSLWVYPGYGSDPNTLAEGQVIEVPWGYSSFPDPLLAMIPESFLRRSRADLRRFRAHAAGGHFAMLENTGALADDILGFCTSVLSPA